MENPITREEHEEFRRRLEEENKRQDTRIGILEDSVRQIGALATSVEKLALSMQSMLKEQEKQGNRLAELGDTVTGRDEIAQADKAYRDAIGDDEWPDWAEKGGEDDGEPYHTGGA